MSPDFFLHFIIASFCFDEFIISDRLICRKPKKGAVPLSNAMCFIITWLNRWYFMPYKYETHSHTHTNKDLRFFVHWTDYECEQNVRASRHSRRDFQHFSTENLRHNCKLKPNKAKYSYCETFTIKMSSKRRRWNKCVLWKEEFSLKITFLIDYVKTHTLYTHTKRWLMICCQVKWYCEHFVFFSRYRNVVYRKISHINFCRKKTVSKLLITLQQSEDLFEFMWFLWPIHVIVDIHFYSTIFDILSMNATEITSVKGAHWQIQWSTTFGCSARIKREVLCISISISLPK